MKKILNKEELGSKNNRTTAPTGGRTTTPTGRLQSAIAAASAKFTAGKDRGKKIFKFMGKLATMSKSSIILLGMY